MKKRRLCTKVFLRKEEDVTLFSVRGAVKSIRVFFHWRIYCFEIRFLCLCMKKIVGLATLHITIEFEYILLSIVMFLWSREENLGFIDAVWHNKSLYHLERRLKSLSSCENPLKWIMVFSSFVWNHSTLFRPRIWGGAIIVTITRHIEAKWDIMVFGFILSTTICLCQ